MKHKITNIALIIFTLIVTSSICCVAYSNTDNSYIIESSQIAIPS